MTSLSNISKNSANLTNISKNSETLSSINKNSETLSNIDKNLYVELDYRSFEAVSSFRATEDNFARILEDSVNTDPQMTSISKNTANLTNILK